MFYSQFILAKKGPLGTIWIAAHLERKLRKNQVADTDIGVSVDSILQPDVPIALRLSSHLLLGVVRIYNRKVNYLFDDCSEALLKVKQAFRATAVDLPPEQSKAPYHSITLPETFDLDDFELPDNDILQGNYVDHHVSSRDQITLQDTMEGVACSTTQFGLDERFGDGDTSGFDLNEDLFLDKVGSSGHAGVSSSTDPQAPVQTIIAVKQGDQHEGMTANSEPMIDEVDEVIHLMEDAQAPRTPGLVEEPNFSNAQETSACDDHFESEHHRLMESAVKENLETGSGETDTHPGDENDDDWSIADDKISHSVVHELSENGFHPGDLDIKQLKPHEISSATEFAIELFSPDNHASGSGTFSHVAQVSPVSELANRIDETSDFRNLKEQMHEGIVDNDKANMCSVHETPEDYERSDGSNLRKSVHEISGSASTCQQALKGVSEYNHSSPVQALKGVSEYNHSSPVIGVSDNLESAGILGKSHSPIKALDLYVDYPVIPCHEQTEWQTLINGQITGAQVQFLRPCTANLNQPDSPNPKGDQSVDPNLPNKNATLDSLEVFGLDEAQHASETFTVAQGEACLVSDGSEKITRDGNMREGASVEGIFAAIGQSNDEIYNGFLGRSHVETVNGSAGPELPPAPEKLMSVREGPGDFFNNLLMEYTPGDLVRNYIGDAGSNVIAGKKRSYTASTLTEQSLNSVEPSRIVRSKRTVDCIPDDNDLLSSILVGRSSPMLKVKPTPREKASVKRTHTAPRTSAVKRKILMDDTMVLHGETIRLQLMNTEDIRRVRKKAPCTCPEITMIQRQFLTDEIFVEPISTGLSIELASLHNQTYDLSGIKISLEGPSADMNKLDEVNRGRLEVNVTQSQGKITADVEPNSLLLEPSKDVTVEAPSADMNKLDEVNRGRLEVNVTPSQVKITADVEPNSLLLEPSEDVTVEAPSADMNKLDEDRSVHLEVHMTQSQVKITADVDLNSLLLEPPEDVAETENNVRSSIIADGVDVGLLDESTLHIDQSDRVDISADLDPVARGDDNSSASMVQTTDNNRTCEADASMRTDDQKIDEVSLRMDATGGEVVYGHNIEGKDCVHTAAIEAELRLTGDEVSMGAAEGDATVETAPDANNRETNYDSHYLGIEQSILDSFFPGEANMHVEGAVLEDGEQPFQEIVNPFNTVDVNNSSAWDHDDDFNYSTAGNDTEFLNFDNDDDDDDEEAGEPDDDSIPNKEVHITDNSGWSSRTRAVSNYLQTLFAKQAGSSRPSLSMDNLLVGKTKKEASRMFFESLVLKTKDYIHVEQGTPFENITINPRTKLMKSTF